MDKSSNKTDKSSILKKRKNIIKLAKGGSLKTDIKQIYKFEQILGGGQFGTVRIGYKKDNPNKKYAVKSISKKNMSQSDLNNLLIEVQILSNLDHPNIIRLLETYQDQNYLHIVTELCTGKNIFTHIKQKGTKTEKEISNIIFKMISAIQYLHENKIVHRDIKAENIIVESNEPDAQVKLIDFGLSKKCSNLNQKMHEKTGTPYYLSPEVINGEYDEKCDIWSIGVVTYLLLIGNLPFSVSIEENEKPNEQELFNKILNDRPNFSSRLWKNYSKKALDFVTKCLEKNPKKRISAQEGSEHPWFKYIIIERQNPEFISIGVLENLRKFSFDFFLKKMVIKYLINTLCSKELKKLEATFNAIDLDSNGKVSKSELATAFNNANIEISEDELNKIFTDEQSEIGYSDFIAACIDLKTFVDKQKLTEAFKYFDVDNNGYIDSKDINNALLRNGKQVREIEFIIEEVPSKAKKGIITFDDFISMFDI